VPGYEKLLVEMLFHTILLPLREMFPLQLSPWFRNGLRHPGKVLWLLLTENRDSRKHKVLLYDSLQISDFYIYNLRAYVHTSVQVCTKAYQYITVLEKLLCWCIPLLFIKILSMMMERKIFLFQKRKTPCSLK